jgi:hypothetical protein
MMKTCQSSIKQSTQQKGKKKRVHDEKSQVQAIDESSKEGGSLRPGACEQIKYPCSEPTLFNNLSELERTLEPLLSLNK